MTSKAAAVATALQVASKPTFSEDLNGYVLDELTPLIGFKNGALALDNHGFEWIGDITAADEGSLLGVPGIGHRKLNVIKTYLAERGLTLSAPNSLWLEYRASHAREVDGQVELHSNDAREAMARLLSRLKTIQLNS